MASSVIRKIERDKCKMKGVKRKIERDKCKTEGEKPKLLPVV